MNQLLQSFELWGEAWAASLWRASWQGAIAIGLVWAIARWSKLVSARVVCWLWRLACLKLLVALFWVQPMLLPVLPAQPADPAVPKNVSPKVVAPAATQPPGQAAETLALERPHAQEHDVSGPFWGSTLFSLWLLGTAISLGGIARQWLSARRLTASATSQVSDSLNEACRQEAERLGVRRAPRLVLSSHVDSPLLAGCWRPVIVLPARLETFEAGEVRLMLAHELAHHRRRDLSWNWLPTIVRALFFFHPLVWFLVRRWSEAQEAACDELLIQNRLAQPVEYGRLLLKLAACEPLANQSALATAGVLGAFRNLERRVMAMSRVRPYSFRRLVLAASVFALLAASSLIPWRLAPQTVAAAVAADDEPTPAKQPGRIYVWVHLDLSSDVPFPHNYRGVIEVDPTTGSWRKIGPLGQTLRLSPDGSRVAYSEFKPRWTRDGMQGGSSELFLAEMQDPQPVKLMEGASLLAWSPDGRQLLYHVNDGSEGWYGTSWSLELATKEKQKLPIPETDQVEDWTSHGDWLVTISGRHANKKEKNGYQVYVMHPDGTEQRRVTQDMSGNLYPHFSSDGKQIAYVRETRTEHGMWVVNVDGSNARQILGKEELGEDFVGGLCWSPDGRSLALKVVENINDRDNRNARLEIVAVSGGAPRALQLKDVTVIHFMQAPEWR